MAATTTTAFTLEPCSIQDGPALAHNNIPAFWANVIWKRTWQHVTLGKQIVETSKRIPRNLLNDRTVLRHQKAVDNTNSTILGYARWLLPESVACVDGVFAWPEAMVPAVPAEEEAVIRAIAEGAEWNPDSSRDDVQFEELMEKTKKRLRAAKAYLGRLSF